MLPEMLPNQIQQLSFTLRQILSCILPLTSFQSYIMCLMDYEYHVLDNAFIIHKPGIKVRDKKVLKSSVVEKQKTLIKTIIKEECDKIYGMRDGCIIVR
ncbi:hypothetical protein Anas_11942 [Armadillidium nasatum]|uniref:Uncharacterized protein n=1 Tax=Armadillidium nasatum TaxID=96803 RepID=A0A5N5SPX3_9CRUS|nr:hypothetical protein Anas_11942 [Armadillidium nasatum]